MANHLISEKSPYLLQHAHNPVDWYAWNDDAFAKAKAEDKPIFLSIGYSTCHWCHVMERESFENESIAQLLNAYFVPIKVDREERPDVDRIYMTFVQATTGSGGWPMSVFLTPDLRPFFGGTYFPPDNRNGRPGFAAILQSLARSWKTDRARIDESSADIIGQLQKMAAAQPSPIGSLDSTILDSAFHYFRRTFDRDHGGFGNAPKFPRPVALEFLLRYYSRTPHEEALEMVLATLRAMAEGGMNDQLAGGFHRYSVDELWFLPHFEKMLYDQGQLVSVYIEAFQITSEAYYAETARKTLDYVLETMTAPEGGFYSAEDADSVIDPAHPHEKGEGAFYVWTRQEVDALLGHPAAAIFASRYGMETNGNVHNDPHGEFPGKNVLYIRRPVDALAKEFGQTPEAIEASLNASIATLLAARSKRVRPHLDDKILTAWNALMISGFAKAAQALNDPRYAQAARRATDFILSHMYRKDEGILLRRYRENQAAIPGFLDDYAFFIQALLDVYETDFQPARLEMATVLADKMMAIFEDPEEGGFFSTASGDANLVVRIKDDYDGAEPSGNSVAVLALLRLAQFTGREVYAKAAERTLSAFGTQISRQPMASPLLLAGLGAYLAPKQQVILAGDPAAPATQAMLRPIRARFAPLRVTILIDSEETRAYFSREIPAIAGMRPVDGETTAYVCENYVCQLPVTSEPRLAELLQ